MALTLLSQADSLKLSSRGPAGRDGRDGIGYLGARERPGDVLALFTSSLSGKAEALAPFASGQIVTTDGGSVLRVPSASDPVIIASRQDFAVEEGQVYAARWVTRRFQNTSDPYGDAVEYRLAWLDAGKAFISTVVADKRALVVNDGRYAFQATFSRDLAADITAPAGARYVRPYVRLLGGNGITDVEVVSRWETTGLPGPKGADGAEPEYFLNEDAETIRWRQADGSIGPELDIGSARKKSEAAADIAAGYASDALTGGMDPGISTFEGISALTIPAGVGQFTVSGRSAMGDGGRALVRIEDAEPDVPALAKTQTANGKWARIVPDALTDVRAFGGITGAALAAALSLGVGIWVPSPANGSPIELNAAQSEIVIANFERIFPVGKLDIKLAQGRFASSANRLMTVTEAQRSIRLFGADPLDLNITAVQSVTPVSGGFDVTYAASNASVVAIGDALKTFEMGPLPIVNGDNAADYVLRKRPLPNELHTPIVNTGRASFAAGGTTVTFAGPFRAPLAECILVGDLITMDGQTRTVTAVNSPDITVDRPWGPIARSNWISVYVSRPNTGTITISGTTVTGAGTAFRSEANVGDQLLCDGELVEILTIPSDTSMTLRKGRTLATASPFTILTNGVYHDGLHEVTAVGAGTVTVRIFGRNAPPINRVVKGSCRVQKTVLKQTGGSEFGDGIVFEQNGAISYIDRIAVLGSRVGGGIGFLMQDRVPALPLAIDGTTSFGNYTQQGYGARALTGPDFGVAQFFHNVTVGHGCYLSCRMGAFSGATGFDMWNMEGSFASVRRAVFSGAGSIGQSVNTGASVKFTEARHVNCVGDGLRLQAGATAYAEAPMAVGNGGMNYRLLGAGGFEIAQGVNYLSGASAFYLIGATVEIKDSLIASSRLNGVDDQSAIKGEFSNCWITGHGSNGCTSYGKTAFPNSAIIGCGNIGLHALDGGEIDARRATVLQNTSAQVRAGSNGEVIFDAGYTTALQIAGHNAEISAASVLGNPSLSGVARFNEFTTSGSIIRDGAAAGVGFSGLRVSGGGLLNFFARVAQAHHFNGGTQVANGAAAPSVTVPITGVTTAMTPTVTLNSLPDGWMLVAICVAGGVRVQAFNLSGSAASIGNGTLNINVFGSAA